MALSMSMAYSPHSSRLFGFMARFLMCGYTNMALPWQLKERIAGGPRCPGRHHDRLLVIGGWSHPYLQLKLLPRIAILPTGPSGAAAWTRAR